MRTPLAAAMLYISHISRASLGTRVRRKLEGTLRHMDQLVTNMLFYARGRGLPMAPVALEALLADVATLVQPIAAAHECRVEFLIGIPNKLLQVNRDAVATAVQNLIINALQACGRGGEVRLYALEQQEDRIELRVSDNGPGIPDDLKQRIFEPFFSTRAQGSGLGLAVARALIQAHDGDIWVKSEPGHGTTFGVTLPVLAPRAGDRNPAQQAAA
jgi:two-component system sensor histidine kinase FlrB